MLRTGDALGMWDLHPEAWPSVLTHAPPAGRMGLRPLGRLRLWNDFQEGCSRIFIQLSLPLPTYLIYTQEMAILSHFLG